MSETAPPHVSIVIPVHNNADTIEEQLGLDQPGGVRAYYQALLKQGLDAHVAQHRMMDCLGEMLRQAGLKAAPPDPGIYLNCLAQLCGARAFGR